jgi:hypothetical protein
MIEARSHLIRAGRGRVKVLRLAANGQEVYPLAYTVAQGQPWCRVCGCTNARSCIGRCAWANARQTLCTRCADRITR